MVPPVRLPSHLGREDDVRVWVKLPSQGALSFRWVPAQRRHVLEYPEGTSAVRVEARRGRVEDVRGTEILRGGRQRFFVYRPDGDDLAGVAWDRGDPRAARAATEALVSLAPPGARDHLRRQNDCAACHEAVRAPNGVPHEHGLVNRGTDSAGFFLIQSVLEDGAPLEAYKPLDPNPEGRFVSFRCRSGTPLVVRERGVRVVCPEGDVPRASVDIRGAVAAADSHALAVCDSRRFLERFLDPSARAALSSELDACRSGLSRAEVP